MRDEIPFIHLLLRPSGLNKLVSGKLALTEVVQDFALLLRLAKNLDLAAPQVLEFINLFVAHGDSPRARPVAGQLKLHFRSGHALEEFLLRLD